MPDIFVFENNNFAPVIKITFVFFSAVNDIEHSAPKSALKNKVSRLS